MVKMDLAESVEGHRYDEADAIKQFVTKRPIGNESG
jgi:hypothetical protein